LDIFENLAKMSRSRKSETGKACVFKFRKRTWFEFRLEPFNEATRKIAKRQRSLSWSLGDESCFRDGKSIAGILGLTSLEKEQRIAELPDKSLLEDERARNGELTDMNSQLLDDFIKEKDARQKLEIKLTNLQQLNAQKDANQKELQTQIHKKGLEVEELSSVRLLMNEAKRDIEDLNRREKQHQSEIEQLSAREQKQFHHMEELAAKERQSSSETIGLREKVGQLTRELDDHHLKIQQSQKALQNAHLTIGQQDAEITSLGSQTRQHQADIGKLLNECSNVQALARELAQKSQVIARELHASQASEQSLRIDRDSLAIRATTVKKELSAANIKVRDVVDLNNQLNERLSREVTLHFDPKCQTKEGLEIFSSKISGLAKVNETAANMETG
jgi:chromosome segregation ATPase